jgi:hypothetical protein
MRLNATRLGSIASSRSFGDQLDDLAGQVPGLDLNFAQNKSLIDDYSGTTLVTFTRASTGTYVGSDGLLKTAVTNLLLRSEEFGTTWTVAGTASITADQATAPIGATTADRITVTSGGPNRLVQSGVSATSTTYTFSVYAKSDDINGICIRTFFSGGTSVDTYSNFVFSSKTFSDTAGAGTFAFEELANGWFRLSATIASGNNTAWEVRIGGLITTAQTGTKAFLWGAQLEQASTVGEYVPTTSVINSAPRFDHNPTTGESLGLLVEEARTNLLLNSATLSTQSVTVAAAANTLSFYGTGTVTLTGVSTAGPLVGTGANNRVSLTFTPTVGVLVVTVSGSVTNAQLEAGAFPTSYIPTVASTVTRAADVASITGSNFSSFYNQTEGAVFVTSSLTGSSTVRDLVNISDGTASNTIAIRYAAASQAQFSITVAGANQVNIAPAGYSTLNQFYNRAIGYKLNDFAQSINTVLVGTDTAGTLPTASRLSIGAVADGTTAFTGTIKRLTYWPKRLADTTLQQITQP